MKLRMMKLCSLLTAFVLLVGSVAALADVVQGQSSMPSMQTQGKVVEVDFIAKTNVSLESSSEELLVGQSHSFLITADTAQVSDGSTPITFRVYYSTPDGSPVYCSFFPTGQTSVSVDAGTTYTLDKEGKYIEYSILPGQTNVTTLQFTTPNGTSGASQQVTVRPEIVIPADANPKDYPCGGAVTAYWKGEFGWEKVKKNAKVVDSSINGATVLSVTEDGHLNGNIEYTISNQDQNGDSVGEIWTDTITFTDKVTLPEGVTLPSNVSYDGNVVKDDSNGNPLFEVKTGNLTNPDVTFTVGTDNRTIEFTVTAKNPNLSTTPAGEIEDPEFTATLYGKNLMVDTTKKEELQTKEINNHVDFVAEPYKGGDPATSYADASTPIRASDANMEIGKVADEKSVAAGGTVHYTITVTNKGDTAKTGSTITDWLPKGMYLEDTVVETLKAEATAKNITFNYNRDSGEMKWENVTVKGNDKVEFKFVADVSDSETLLALGMKDENFVNKASDGQKTVEVPVKYDKPNVSVTKVKKEDKKYNVGDTVEYDLKATNNGDAAAENVVLRDVLPKGLTLLSDDGKTEYTTGIHENETIGRKPATVTVNEDGTTIVVWKETIEPGDEHALTMTLKTKVNELALTSSNLGNKFESPNDQANAWLDVNKPKFNLTKSHEAPNEDGVLTYTLKAHNTSQVDAKNVTMTDTMGKGLIPTFADGTPLKVGENVINDNLTVLVEPKSDGGYILTWTVDEVAAGETKTFKLYAKVGGDLKNLWSDQPDTIKLTNKFETEYGGSTEDPHYVPKPKIEKTLAQSGSFSAGETVEFILKAWNEHDTPTTGFVMWDTLPKELVPVDEAGNVIAPTAGDATVEIGGKPATVVKNSNDGTTTITWDVGVVPARGEVTIRLKAKVQPYEDNVKTLTNKLNDNWGNESKVEVPLKPKLDFDKKILIDGQEYEKSTLTEGYTVTYILKLINDSGEDKEFSQLQDTLPDHYNKFSYVKGTSGASVDGNAIVEIVNYDKATYTIGGKVYNVVPLFETTRSVGNRNIGDWHSLTVPAGHIAISLVKVTCPTGESWKKFKEEYFKKGNLENTFHCQLGDKKVTHDIEPEIGELYMRKGVYELGKVNAQGYFGGSRSNSLTQYTFNETYTNGASVIYYVSIVNTNAETPVAIKSLVDTLPKGIKFARMFDSDNVNNGLHYKTNNANLKSSGEGNSFLANDKNTAATIKGVVTSGNTVTFQFDDVFMLQPGSYLNFAFACDITAEADMVSTNTLTLKTNGLVYQGNDNVGRDHLEGRNPNDGSCTRVKYDETKKETIFTSSVTIERVDETDTNKAIVPGITKEAVARIISGSTSEEPITSGTILAAADTLVWEIKLINAGAADMPVQTLSDIVDYPYVIEGDPVLTLEGTTYTLKGGTRTPESIAGMTFGDSTTYTYGLYRDGNTLIAPPTDAAVNNYLVIPHGKYATVKVKTRNASSNPFVYKTGYDFFNKATLTPCSPFERSSAGVNENPTEEGLYTAVSARDSIVIRNNFATASNKVVEEAGKHENQVTSYQATSEGHNYIKLSDGVREVYFTLNVTNQGKNPLDKLVIIDNLPRVGDLGSVSAKPRGSEFAINFANELVVRMEVKHGDSKILSSSEYTLEFSDKVPKYREDDYYGTSDWSGSGGSTSFRITLNNPVPSGATVSVKFKATVPEDVTPGSIAWNTFGYGAIQGENKRIASPPRVGVSIGEPPKANFEFTKTGSGSTVLPGAEFALFDALSGDDVLKVLNNTTLDEAERRQQLDKALPADTQRATSGTDGKVSFTDLVAGNYMLFETKAPKGYKLPTGYWNVTVAKNKEGQGFTITIQAAEGNTNATTDSTGFILPNEPDIVEPPELPSVGGSGTRWLMLGGALAMVMAIALLAANKHKRKEEGIG